MHYGYIVSVNTLMDSSKISYSICRFTVQSADGLAMTFREGIVTTMALRRGACRINLVHHLHISRSSLTVKLLSLVVTNKYEKLQHINAISKISCADTGTRALSIK